MISEQVRAAELEIDETIRQLAIWKCPKNLLLRQLMNSWRDGVELTYMKFARGVMFQNSDSFEASTSIEHQVNTGVFWCLKWALEYASNVAGPEPSAEQVMAAVIDVGAPYQLLVDALKFATVGGNEIDIDTENRALIIYEGGNLSGYDQAIVSLDHALPPTYQQTPLAMVEKLRRGSGNRDVFGAGWPAGAKTGAFRCPVVLKLQKPPAELTNLHWDLTLTQNKIDSGMKWKIAEWQDCPLLQIGPDVYCISSLVKALADSEDYMLRVAVLNDREQYEKVSGLREERMLGACQAVFEDAGWKFQPHFRLKDPVREIDGYASKCQQDVIIQLKSTLRPHSPWEVYKRNSDLIGGITHTTNVLTHFREEALGFVVTDGYEGDYATWRESCAPTFQLQL